MNEKHSEQKNVSRKRVLTAAIAIIAILAVVAGCLALSGCNKKKTTDDATADGSPSVETSQGGDTSGGTSTDGVISVNNLLSKKEGTVYYSPSSVSVTEKGTVYVSDATNFAVYKLSAKGEVEKTALFSATVNKVVATDTAVYALAGELGGQLFVLDGDLNVKSKIAVGHTPVDLYIKDKTAYVANRYSNSISVVDLSAGKVTSTINVGREPYCMTEAKGVLYVGCMLPDDPSNGKLVSSDVCKVDLSSGKVTGLSSWSTARRA